MQKDLTEVKIFQKVLGWLLFFNHPVYAADVQRVILSIPAKSSPLDIVPTSLLKSCSDVFAVVIARLANLSFRDGRFPTCFKLAEVLSLLKKSGATTSRKHVAQIAEGGFHIQLGAVHIHMGNRSTINWTSNTSTPLTNEFRVSYQPTG